jgi:hypothetical protein
MVLVRLEFNVYRLQFAKIGGWELLLDNCSDSIYYLLLFICEGGNQNIHLYPQPNPLPNIIINLKKY